MDRKTKPTEHKDKTKRVNESTVIATNTTTKKSNRKTRSWTNKSIVKSSNFVKIYFGIACDIIYNIKNHKSYRNKKNCKKNRNNVKCLAASHENFQQGQGAFFSLPHLLYNIVSPFYSLCFYRKINSPRAVLLHHFNSVFIIMYSSVETFIFYLDVVGQPHLIISRYFFAAASSKYDN